MTATQDELLAAWLAWDRAPGSTTTAHRMQAATSAAAAELDMSALTLRRALADARRDGLTHQDALDQIWTRAGSDG